jgi:mannose-6-phosphate isomerase-like protein (cupin superfamily)
MAEDAGGSGTTQVETIQLWGSVMIVRVPGEATGGAYSVLEYLAPPTAGSGPHWHGREDETFYILEGALTAQIGDERVRAEPGQMISIPVGTRHSFANAEPVPLRALVLLRPAGLEGYFRDLGEIAARDANSPPSREELTALAEKYGLKFEGLNA